MTNFEKFYKSNINQNWEKDYIDYDYLIDLINKSMKVIQTIAENNKIELNSLEKLEDPIDISSILQIKSEFMNEVDKEIKKFYYSYAKYEKKIYKEINKHTYSQTNYSQLSLFEINNEVKSLILISELVINVEKFVILNFMTIKNVLTIFDQSFSFLFGNIYNGFIKDILNGNNSNLKYIIHLKIIDEASALLSYFSESIQFSYCQIYKNEVYLNSLYDNKEKISDIERNILDDEWKNKEKLKIITVQEYSSIYDCLLLNIKYINEESQNIRVYIDINDWTYNSLEDTLNKQNINDNIIKYETMSHLIPMKNEDILNVSQVFNKESKESKDKSNNKKYDSSEKEYLSIRNKLNIYLIFINLILGVLSEYSIICDIGLYLSEISSNLNIPIKKFALLSLISPIAYLFGTFLFSISSKLRTISYKTSLILSFFFFSIGNFLFIFKSSLTFIIISRILIGMGNSKISSKNYILEHIPIKCQMYYLKIIQIITFISLSSIFLIASINHYLTSLDLSIEFKIFIKELTVSNKEYEIFICCFLLFLSFLFLILTCFLFSNPNNINFQVYNYNTKISSSSLPGISPTYISNEISYNTINKSRLSDDDLIMISNIDNELNKINKESNFSDTNNIRKSIQTYALSKNKVFQKRFFSILILISFSKILFETCISLLPMSIMKLSYSVNHIFKFNNSTYLDVLSLFMLFIFILVVIFGIKSFYGKVVYNEKVIIKYSLLFILLTSLIGIVNHIFLIKFNIFFFLVMIIFTFSIILEGALLNLLIKIVPDFGNIFCVDKKYTIVLINSISRIISGFVIYFSYAIIDNNENNIINSEHHEVTIYYLLLILSFISCFIYFFNRKIFSMDAITRIVKYDKEYRV